MALVIEGFQYGFGAALGVLAGIVIAFVLVIAYSTTLKLMKG